jgi:hypothetical protein
VPGVHRLPPEDAMAEPRPGVNAPEIPEHPRPSPEIPGPAPETPEIERPRRARPEQPGRPEDVPETPADPNRPSTRAR